MKYFFEFKNRIKLINFYSDLYINTYYISCELFYLKNYSGVADTFIISDTTFNYSAPRPPGHNAYTDFFYMDKQRFGLNLKIGIKQYLNDNFFVEPHIGIGIVYRKIVHYERENMNDELADRVLSYDKIPGNMFTPNLPLNIKIGYSF